MKNWVCWQGSCPFVPGSRKTGNLAVGDLLWTDGSGNILGTAKDRKKKKAGSIFLWGLSVMAGILLLSWQPRKGLRITCLDIGQGDGIVLEMPEKGVFLMDCGSSNKKNIAAYQLLPYLKSRGISYIDGILVSHTDNDHISGIQELMEYMTKGLTSVKAGTLMLPQWKEKPEAYQRLEKLAKEAGIQVLYMEQGNSFLWKGKIPDTCSYRRIIRRKCQ